MPIVIASVLAILLTLSGPAASAGEALARIPRGDRLVLQASTGGGFVPDEVARNQFPELTITRDGRVITLGPTTLEYPGKALPNVQVGRISRTRVRELLETAESIGLHDDEHPDYGDPQITDNPSTTVTVVAGGERVTTSVYAPGYDGDDLTDEQRANRKALTAFLSEASETRRTRAYRPEAMAVLVTEHEGADTAEPALDWPLGDLSEVLAGSDELREGCLLVTGEDLVTVLDTARNATTLTPWTSVDRQYDLVFRPLLPNERDCDDLT
jgi:hypothetical protein